FGNDPEQQGVDKIIHKLVIVANDYLEDAEREELLATLASRLSGVDERMEVLRLRLRVAGALLQGDEASAVLGAELNAADTELAIATPVALALMCDAAVEAGDVNEMRRLYDYFLATYEESDLLWHAYRAKTYELLLSGDLQGVLAIIDEAQGLFGAESYMGWAQLLKADTLFKLKDYEEAEVAFNMVMGVSEWRGPIFAEAMYGMGQCRLAQGDLKAAHSFFQRTYLLFKSYANGDWAAKGYLGAANTLVELGRNDDAVNTLNAMLEDQYTSSNPLAKEGRELLKKYGGL
ncbi:MAG: tetratricopeptide repeat protein, partial [Pontiella sp.]|nr:tetratricopeptide repeat protein [Pontiella sp.]